MLEGVSCSIIIYSAFYTIFLNNLINKKKIMSGTNSEELLIDNQSIVDLKFIITAIISIIAGIFLLMYFPIFYRIIFYLFLFSIVNVFRKIFLQTESLLMLCGYLSLCYFFIINDLNLHEFNQSTNFSGLENLNNISWIFTNLSIIYFSSTIISLIQINNYKNYFYFCLLLICYDIVGVWLSRHINININININTNALLDYLNFTNKNQLSRKLLNTMPYPYMPIGSSSLSDNTPISYYNISSISKSQGFIEKLALNNKWATIYTPYHMLGAGDIIFAGILLQYLFNQSNQVLYKKTLFMYFISLIGCFILTNILDDSIPALIIILPLINLPTLLTKF